MPAIIRQTMSRNLARDLLNDVINATGTYYIGIGKSDVFNENDTVVAPVDSRLEEKEFRNNLQSIKRVEGATFVAKRYNWTSGSVYSGWDDGDDNITPHPFYVMNDAKEVYLCLETGMTQTGEVNVSTIEPNYGALGVDHKLHFRTGDGYVWKFLFTLTPENIFQHLSSNWIPVDLPEDSLAGGDAIEDLQYEVSTTAVGGQIIRGEITNPGSGYGAAPTVTVVGDGEGATAVAYINNGSISKIEMTSYGHSYTYATFVINGDGVDGKVRAVITDSNGLGFDPVNDLKTSSVMFNIKPNGEENGTFIVENSFRQMGLIKNPLTPTGIAYTNTSAKVLPTLTLDSTSPFESGKKITGAQSGAVAYVNQSEGNIVHFHQNESTGFLSFQNGESVTQEGVVTTGVINSQQLKNGIDRFTGDVLYIENRYRIRRDAEQQEDIKIVITL
jgi:hypothetical protein